MRERAFGPREIDEDVGVVGVAKDGHQAWVKDLRAHLESSPLAVDGSLYIGTDTHEVVALLNAYFGAVVTIEGAHVHPVLGAVMVVLAFTGTSFSQPVLKRMNDRSFRLWTRGTVMVPPKPTVPSEVGAESALWPYLSAFF